MYEGRHEKKRNKNSNIPHSQALERTHEIIEEAGWYGGQLILAYRPDKFRASTETKRYELDTLTDGKGHVGELWFISRLEVYISMTRP